MKIVKEALVKLQPNLPPVVQIQYRDSSVLNSLLSSRLVQEILTQTNSWTSPLLPEHCLQYEKKERQMLISLYYPPIVKKINISTIWISPSWIKDLPDASVDGDILKVSLPIPGRIWAFKIEKAIGKTDAWKLLTSRLGVVKCTRAEINDQTPLYSFPYGHVYKTGNLCMTAPKGSSAFRSLLWLENWDRDFLDGIFEGHISSLRSTEVVTLIQEVASHPSKPVDWSSIDIEFLLRYGDMIK